jgi:PAS domain S-box-containing protein
VHNETSNSDLQKPASQPTSILTDEARAVRLLSAIVESSDDAIVSKNLDGTITSWNKAAERLFQFTAQEMIGQSIYRIIPDERRSEEKMIIDNIKQGKRVDHFETVRRRKDNSLVDVSVTISPVRDNEGRVIGASKIARDISERKRIELERQTFVTLANHCPEFIGMCDLSLRPFYVNDAAMRLVGLDSLEAVQSVSVADFFFPEDRDFITNEFLPKVLREGAGEVEVRFRHFKTGAPIWMIYNVFVIRDSTGQVIAIATFSQNITGRKQAEDAVRKSEERLRGLSERLETEVSLRTRQLEQRSADVLAGSEKLRNLARRMMQIQDDERRRLARDLHDSAGQLLAALGIKVAYLAQRVRPELTADAQDAEQMLQQLTKEIRTTSYLLHPPLLDEIGLPAALNWYVQGILERSELDIQLNIQDDLGRLSQDLELVIFRLVQECLTNIHRHSGSKAAAINLSQQNSRVRLEVQDYGQGIAPAKLAEIQSYGSGVGIQGMRERVHQFNGELTIESNESGTKVIATFPVRQAASTPEACPSLESAS